MLDRNEPRREKRMDAAKAGRKKYIPAIPCQRCLTSLRYTSSGTCVCCVTKRAAEFHASVKAALKGE